MTKMNRLVKRVVTVFVLVLVAAAWAMPTKQQLAEAQQIVRDLTAADIRALNAKEKTAATVAANHLALADKADTEAGKYLLLQGAFRLYARSGDYDAAAAVLQRMRGEIAELPPELIVEIVNDEMRRVAADKAPKVLAIFRDAQRTIKCRKELTAVEAAAKAKPGDMAAQRRLAECYVILGDWAKALETFAKFGEDAAKFELDPASAKGYDVSKAADFWWNYPTKDDEPFKVHAATIYQKGLADGKITGLRKTLAEKRVKEMESVMPAANDAIRGNGSPAASGSADVQPKTKMLDLGGGVKMEMIYVAPGSFMMGNDNGNRNQRPVHKVTLTKGYWLGKYEVTQKQWRQVMGSVPSKFKGDDLPVDGVSWEACQAFIKKVNRKLGGNMARLPTEAEWEYACRAGTDGDFAGTGRLDDMGWYKNNSGDNTHPVGQKQANAWGFYDMHGNVWEWCGDWWGEYPQDDVSDPVGPASGTERTFRGGSWGSPMGWCPSTYRWKTKPGSADGYAGFRLCMSADQNAPSSSFVSRGSGAPAASDGRTEEPTAKVVAPASAPAAKGKEISVKLATNVMMDFVPCPAGTFEMGVSDDLQSAKFKHKVTITRPFWIGKYQVTLGQWRVFKSSDLDECEKALGGMEKAKNGVKYAVAMAYCNFLMKKYKRYLPKGYVYRLPTEAEWEYALHANCSDENDPYVQVFLQPKNVEAWKKIAVENGDIKQMAQDNGFPVARLPQYDRVLPPMKVGTKLPNSWGVYDMLGNGVELLLDTVQIDNFKKRWGRNEHTDLYGLLKYKTEEVDPLRMVSGNASCPCCLVRTKSKTSLREPLFDKMVNDICGGAQTYNTFRVVIGPDLLKERGIKLSNLGK